MFLCRAECVSKYVFSMLTEDLSCTPRLTQWEAGVLRGRFFDEKDSERIMGLDALCSPLATQWERGWG
jgi:hypothetical protein